MSLKPDVLTVFYVGAIAILSIWAWRTVAGLAPDTLKKAMFSVVS